MKRIKNFISNFMDYLLSLPVQLKSDYRLKNALLSSSFILLIMIAYYFMAYMETNSFEYHKVVQHAKYSYLSGEDGIIVKHLSSQKTVAENSMYKITTTEKNGKFEVLNSEYKINLFNNNIIIHIPLDISYMCFIVPFILIFVIVFKKEDIAESK